MNATDLLDPLDQNMAARLAAEMHAQLDRLSAAYSGHIVEHAVALATAELFQFRAPAGHARNATHRVARHLMDAVDPLNTAA